MELNWSTFLLEMINFLVLVWILKHFLYQPILSVIAKRQESIAAGIAEAQQLNASAEALKREYENRLCDWQDERQKALDSLHQELNEEKLRQLQVLKGTLDEERQKARVKDDRRQRKKEHEIEHRALLQAAEFAARLLSRAAGPELQSRLFDILTGALVDLSDERLAQLRSQWGEAPGAIDVSSAHALSRDQQQQLESLLSSLSGVPVAVSYRLDPELLAGLRIHIDSRVLQLNVRDDLKDFTEFAYAVH